MDCKRKVIIYSAVSLDGYIAKPDGDLKWLLDSPNPEKIDHGYGDFIKKIDTTIIGRKTFDQIITEYDIVYPGMKNYVFTKTPKKASNNVEFISSDIIAFVSELKRNQGKDIWIVGGGEINRILIENNLVDILHVQIIPIILNKGISMFNCNRDEINLKFIKTHAFSTGVVDIVYEIEKNI